MSLLLAQSRSRLARVTVPVLLAVGLAASPSAAAGPVLTIDPAGSLPTGTQTVTVSGSGFDPGAAGGAGIYLAFGPITAAPGFYTDPSVYAVFKWISVGGPDSPATAPMAADGTFHTDLEVPSAFTSGAGPVDCSVTVCAVLAFAAHGSSDRTQDACLVVSFDAGAASGAPSSAAPAPSIAASPLASPAPAAASGVPATPVAADSCAAIVSAP